MVELWLFCHMSQISFIGFNSQISLLNEEFHTSDDGLRVEVVIETLLEVRPEVEEEKHQFASL